MCCENMASLVKGTVQGVGKLDCEDSVRDRYTEVSNIQPGEWGKEVKHLLCGRRELSSVRRRFVLELIVRSESVCKYRPSVRRGGEDGEDGPCIFLILNCQLIFVLAM
jgi:hypothetical protein